VCGAGESIAVVGVGSARVVRFWGMHCRPRLAPDGDYNDIMHRARAMDADALRQLQMQLSNLEREKQRAFA
jgi:hypothetical protein